MAKLYIEKKESNKHPGKLYDALVYEDKNGRQFIVNYKTAEIVRIANVKYSDLENLAFGQRIEL